MKIREIRKEDIDRIVEIVNRNYDEVMAKVHTKEVIRKFKEHNTLDNWQRQMTWMNISLRESHCVGEIEPLSRNKRARLTIGGATPFSSCCYRPEIKT